MPPIIPAVIPRGATHLDETLKLFSALSSSVQIDIVDGIFARGVSWPYGEGVVLQSALQALDLSGFEVELDLMIKDPEATLELWRGLSPRRIVIHVESTNNIEAIFNDHALHHYELGLALNNDTDIDRLLKLPREHFDYVQLMGIKDIGVQGQPFDERVLDRIGRIKAAYKDMPISIDGSVNRETLPRLKAAGADRFVVGSAILNANDPRALYKELLALAS